MVSISSIVATVAVAAVSVQIADAHTYITSPMTEFKSGASKSSWVAEFPPPWEGSFKTGAEYAAAASAKGFKDLKSFLESKGPSCGNSLPNAKPKAIPSNGRVSLASTIEHAGPCEIWLDGTRAYHNDDCEKTLGSATSIPVDFSSCKGSCMLRFYWLGLQASGRRWQAYKNCIPLGGGGGGNAASDADTGDNKSSTTTTSEKKSTSGDAKTTKPTKAPKKKSGEARSFDDLDELIAEDAARASETDIENDAEYLEEDANEHDSNWDLPESRSAVNATETGADADSEDPDYYDSM